MVADLRVKDQGRHVSSTQPAHPPAVGAGAGRAHGPVTTRRIGSFLLVDACGALDDVAEPTYQAALRAAAEEPAAVICDLTGVVGRSHASATRLLASLGSEVRQWPGVAIAIACPGANRLQALAQAPEGQHLLLAEHRTVLLAQLGRRAAPEVVRMDMTPSARLVRSARDLTTRALLDWGCPQPIAPATLIVSELVNNAILHARTDLTVSVARWGDLVRLAVHDATPELPVRRHEPTQVTGRGMLLVAALSQSWGVLPASGGGKVVWAVIQAPPEGRPDHHLRLVDDADGQNDHR